MPFVLTEAAYTPPLDVQSFTWKGPVLIPDGNNIVIRMLIPAFQPPVYKTRIYYHQELLSMEVKKNGFQNYSIMKQTFQPPSKDYILFFLTFTLKSKYMVPTLDTHLHTNLKYASQSQTVPLFATVESRIKHFQNADALKRMLSKEAAAFSLFFFLSLKISIFGEINFIRFRFFCSRI